MLLYLVLAGLGLLALRRYAPGATAPDSPEPAAEPEGDLELGVAEDGTMVLVPAFTPSGVEPGNLVAPTPAGSPSAPWNRLNQQHQADAWGQPTGVRSNRSAVVGHLGSTCKPGGSCCAECRSGSVGWCPPAVSDSRGAVRLSSVRSMARALAQQVAYGNAEARERAVQIFDLALSGRDPQARVVAEELERAMQCWDQPGARFSPSLAQAPLAHPRVRVDPRLCG